MLEYLPQALSSLGTALEVAKNLTTIRDSKKLQDAVIQFNTSIIDAQSKIMSSQTEQAALKETIGALEKECVRLKDWEAERKTYSRKEIARGIFAYVNNDQVGNFQSAHKYCCNCFDDYKKSTLQQFHVEVGRKVGLSCHNKCPDLIFNHYLDFG